LGSPHVRHVRLHGSVQTGGGMDKLNLVQATGEKVLLDELSSRVSWAAIYAPGSRKGPEGDRRTFENEVLVWRRPARDRAGFRGQLTLQPGKSDRYGCGHLYRRRSRRSTRVSAVT
jgi:hypothetical protein